MFRDRQFAIRMERLRLTQLSVAHECVIICQQWP